MTSRQDRFQGLLEEHRKILFKVAIAYGREPSDREDLVQEMVLQLWRSFARYDERQRFSTWMYRVAFNVAVSFYRRETLRAPVTVAADVSILAIAAESDVENSEEELRLLSKVLQELDPLDRALILLYLDGKQHAEIAEVLGISETNVGTKIGRLKKRIRRSWPDPRPGA